jgi:hypothetical protein
MPIVSQRCDLNCDFHLPEGIPKPFGAYLMSVVTIPVNHELVVGIDLHKQVAALRLMMWGTLGKTVEYSYS